MVEEAREVNRDATARCETDATLWCNLAVTELLCGDVAEAKRCLAKSHALDPNDPIAAALERRIEQITATGRFPRTLAELEGRVRKA